MQALPVMEQFLTIQGEGAHQGKAAYFIRLAGCDVGCVWCDVKDSWDAHRYPLIAVDQLATQASQTNCRLAVVTGGEPLMYNLSPLTEQLRLLGFSTHLETSGAHPLTGYWDWICFSPKKFKSPVGEIPQQAHELKVVIYHSSDFEWAEKYAEQVSATCVLSLQPEWSKQDKLLPSIIDYVQRHPRWRISLQTHKYMQIP